MNNIKGLNRLYEQCNSFIGKTLTKDNDTISIKFAVKINEFENGEYISVRLSLSRACRREIHRVTHVVRH